MDRPVDVPPWQQARAHQPAAGLPLHVGHRVVPDLDDRHPQLVVADPEEVLAAEADHIREQDLPGHPERVHHRHPRCHVGSREGGLVERPFQEGCALDLLVFAVDHAARARGAEDLVPVDDPHRRVGGRPGGAQPGDLLAHVIGQILVQDDPRHAVHQVFGGARRPQVRRLGQVRVDIDDLDTAHRLVDIVEQLRRLNSHRGHPLDVLG
jgi:hypothetical protein